jgi:hypothetical protein
VVPFIRAVSLFSSTPIPYRLVAHYSVKYIDKCQLIWKHHSQFEMSFNLLRSFLILSSASIHIVVPFLYSADVLLILFSQPSLFFYSYILHSYFHIISFFLFLYNVNHSKHNSALPPPATFPFNVSLALFSLSFFRFYSLVCIVQCKFCDDESTGLLDGSNKEYVLIAYCNHKTH